MQENSKAKKVPQMEENIRQRRLIMIMKMLSREICCHVNNFFYSDKLIFHFHQLFSLSNVT